MKLCIAAIVAISLAPSALAATMPPLISQARYDTLVISAKAASYLCETELSGGRWGSQCDVYRQAATSALGMQELRLRWCRRQAELFIAQHGADATYELPLECVEGEGDPIRFTVIERLMRQADPAAFAEVDALGEAVGLTGD